MRKTLITSLFLMALSVVAHAQEPAKKPLSPPASATGSIGAAKITIDYSAPSKRGREIMGGLVPYGKVWRTGANAATTLTTDRDLMIGHLNVPAGKYTLYTIPNAKEWTLIVNKQNGQWGTEYDEKQDLGRVTLAVKSTKAPVETFVIDVKPARTRNEGEITFTWEGVEAVAPVTAR
ncbi:MAG: hypothetical protein JWN02_1614 [Acidobacteria bacterium]|nr:hypothetical protein [Acidobacteriota bacterium]